MSCTVGGERASLTHLNDPLDSPLHDLPRMPAAAPPRGRIAIVLPSLAGGGVERVVLSLARGFLAGGHAVDIVLRRARGELLGHVPGGARLVNLGCERLSAVPLAFARYLRRERPDAVIANMWPLTSLCVIGHRLARSPVRLAVVEHAPLSPVAHYRTWRRRPLLRGTLALGCRLADASIAVSAGVAADIAALAGLAPHRLRVIYNPIEIPPQAEAGGGEALWGQGHGPRILSVGRLSAEKNQALLLEAFAALRTNVNARLVILGEGPLRAALEAQAARLGLGDAVRLPGFLANPWPAYRAADLFVLSSDYEGFGNVIVEALAAGLPVVSTDCPAGPREILAGGAFGTLVPCGNAPALAAAMLATLKQPRDPERLRIRAAEFSPEVARDAYLQALFGTGEPGCLPAEAARC